MYDCAVPGCKAKGVHNFPRNEQFRKLWEITAKMDESTIYNPTKTCKICSTHFKPDAYFKEGFYTGVKNKKRFLKKNAVPSRFPWNTKKKSLLKKMGIDLDKKEQPEDTTKPAEPSAEITETAPAMEVTQDQDKNVDKMDQDPLYALESSGIPNLSSQIVKVEVSFEVVDESTMGTLHNLDEKNENKDSSSTVSAVPEIMGTPSVSAEQKTQDNISKMEVIPSKIPTIPQTPHIKITESQIMEALQAEVKQDKTELRLVKQKNKQLISMQHFTYDISQIHDYTGIESYEKLIAIYETLGPEVLFLQSRRNVISSDDQFLLTLIKLRQNKDDESLAKLFTITPAVASNIFITWVDFLYEKWKMINLSPERVEILVSPEDYLSKADKNNDSQNDKKGKGKKGKPKKKSGKETAPKLTVPDTIPEAVSNTFTIMLTTENIKHVSRPKLYLVCKILCCFIDNTLNPAMYRKTN